MRRTTRLASAQPSTHTWSPLSSVISIVPEVRVALRRRAGRTPPSASAIAGSSATSTGENVSPEAALGADRLSMINVCHNRPARALGLQ